MSKIEVAVYYFPQYHPDPRNDAWHGHGWTEWELMKAAKSRFPGHRQPIIPAMGYFDESDPEWAAKEIALAADHGVTCFIYDWYWWEDGPFLQDGLEKGFLQAPNNERLKFALMWANHGWINIHPSKFAGSAELLARGEVSRDAFERITDHVVETYFSRPNYWKIKGEPYFSIYETDTFINGLGGIEAAVEALDSFRAKTIAAGFPGLHLNLVHMGNPILPIESTVKDLPHIAGILGAASIGSYTWVHHYNIHLDGFPHGNYARAAEANYKAWAEHEKMFSMPYHLNVTMGWDSSPRTIQSDVYECVGYPWCSVLDGNTPDAFRKALERAKAFVSGQEQPVVSINAWNEWTEGSYLLPDTVFGNGYLEAIREVFG